MPTKTVRLTPQADADLAAIYRYSESVWGDSVAERYIRKISNIFQVLLANPSVGKSCTFISPNLCARACGSHVTFYRPTDFGIAVIRILHKSMNYPAHL